MHRRETAFRERPTLPLLSQYLSNLAEYAIGEDQISRLYIGKRSGDKVGEVPTGACNRRDILRRDGLGLGSFDRLL